MTQSIYDIEVKKNTGETYKLEEYKGQVMVIVNTATKCGLKGQFEDLEEIYQCYKDQGLVVLGFPCNQFANQEPETDDTVAQTCKINFGVTFPLHAKIDVNGKNEHPLFTYLKEQQNGLFNSKIKWNFTKFLIDREGNVVKRFAPKDKPQNMIEDIEKLL